MFSQAEGHGLFLTHADHNNPSYKVKTGLTNCRQKISNTVEPLFVSFKDVFTVLKTWIPDTLFWHCRPPEEAGITEQKNPLEKPTDILQLQNPGPVVIQICPVAHCKAFKGQYLQVCLDVQFAKYA